VPAYLVNDGNELKPEWFDGKSCVGISAGASAPEVLVKGVLEKLEQFGALKVTELQGIIENVVFPIPKALNPDVTQIKV
jgi:4-hydroxy-3-methylbut-2-enyl diphosphate reductase